MVCGSLASAFHCSLTHTQKSTTLQTHTHTHTPYSTYIHLHTLYAFHTLLFLLTHFLSGIRTGVLCCRYINGGQWGPWGLQWLFLPSKNLRKVLAGWSWKPTKFSSSRLGSGGHQCPLKNKMEKKKRASKQSIRQKCMTAKFEHCFCDGNDRPFAPLPLPHIWCLRPPDFQRLGSHQ